MKAALLLQSKATAGNSSAMLNLAQTLYQALNLVLWVCSAVLNDYSRAIVYPLFSCKILIDFGATL